MVVTTQDRDGRVVTLIPCPLKDGYSLFVTIRGEDGFRAMSMVKLTVEQAKGLASELVSKMYVAP